MERSLTLVLVTQGPAREAAPKLAERFPHVRCETGSVLVGSPEQIIDKFGRYQAALGHELSGIATEVPGLPDDLNRESVERFVGDVIPALRAAYPSRVWTS
jgi:alkanesulfonate monooxygenase SsuD/methylene tetrahydromethanopterin reductase-like flavin-dependent oxidoreductase (luciferase family)